MFHHVFEIVAAARSLLSLSLTAPAPTHLSDSAAGAVFASSRKLTSLQLQRILLKPTTLKQLLPISANHPLAAVSVLQLCQCGLGLAEAQHLGALIPLMPALQELALAHNQLDADAVDALFQTGAGPHTNPLTLKLLDLSSNPLESAGASWWQFRFRLDAKYTSGASGAGTTVSATSAATGSSSARACVPITSATPWPALKDALAAGGSAVERALPRLTALSVLRLASASLADLGVRHVAAGFVSARAARKATHKLTELALEHNEAGDTGAEALAEAVAGMPEVVKLAYAGNRPGFRGLVKLASAIAACPALQVRCWCRVSASYRAAVRVPPAS